MREFCAEYMTRLKDVYDRHMAGTKRHACEFSTLLLFLPAFVLPLKSHVARCLVPMSPCADETRHSDDLDVSNVIPWKVTSCCLLLLLLPSA